MKYIDENGEECRCCTGAEIALIVGVLIGGIATWLVFAWWVLVKTGVL